MNQRDASPTILVAPLDWGLGHATRCIPIIQQLIRQNCRVVIAASGKGKALLQQEFPALEVLHLPGYEIVYAASGWGLAVKIVAQIPKLISAIKKEQAWLQKVVKEKSIDAVISDNRYGLYHPVVPSVFITHQLRIKAPLTTAEAFLQRLNYAFINRFQACWVPDHEGENNLAGSLSHPQKKPSVPLVYTGPLTRFQRKQSSLPMSTLLILLSGPEPQRTLLEDRLIKDLKEYTGPVVLVRGLPGSADHLAVAPHVTVYNHLPAAELAEKISDAFMVVARCGYSTVMDLAAFEKKSILVPTPGQTEQEYLARHLIQQGLAFCVAQNKFRLKTSLQMAAGFSYHPFPTPETGRLENVVGEFLLSL